MRNPDHDEWPFGIAAAQSRSRLVENTSSRAEPRPTRNVSDGGWSADRLRFQWVTQDRRQPERQERGAQAKKRAGIGRATSEIRPNHSASLSARNPKEHLYERVQASDGCMTQIT